MKKNVLIGISIIGTILFIILILGTFGVLFMGQVRTFSSQMGDISGSSNEMMKSIDSNRFYETGSVGTADSEGASASPSFQAMYFQNYGTNIFLDTKIDSLSTFAVDVDTASYSIAKNYIMRGQLPPTDAIRPEEFINYFDYGYKNPTSDFAIYTEVAKSPYGDDISYLKIGLKAKEQERKDVVLTFVIDISGSMNQENRLGLVKKSLHYLVEEMRPNDKIGIVVYDTTASISLEHTTDKEKVLEVIDALYTKGSTNAEAGLILGYKQANKYFESEKVNRVILLSDGVANVGNTDSNSILSQLKSYKDKGIALTAVGVGMGNYNDVLLEQIADKADGNYAYINDITEAKRLFSKQFSSTIQTVAKDAKIQVEFDENTVKRYRLIGYENRELADEAFEANIDDAGEIGAGHEVTAIYELELEGAGNIGNIRFRYEDVDTSEIEELSKNIGSKVTSFGVSSDGFKKSIAVARFAQILKLVQPPPTIDIVYEILEGLNLNDETDSDFKDVVYNAQKLIEDKR